MDDTCSCWQLGRGDTYMRRTALDDALSDMADLVVLIKYLYAVCCTSCEDEGRKCAVAALLL